MVKDLAAARWNRKLDTDESATVEEMLSAALEKIRNQDDVVVQAVLIVEYDDSKGDSGIEWWRNGTTTFRRFAGILEHAKMSFAREIDVD